jgi:hypothetical protein
MLRQTLFATIAGVAMTLPAFTADMIHKVSPPFGHHYNGPLASHC